MKAQDEGGDVAQLALACERMSEAMDTWGIGIYDHDHVGDTIYGTPLFRELYGVDAQVALTVEVLGAAIFPADMAMAMHAVQRAHDPAADGSFDLLHRIVRKSDGTVHWVHSRAKTTFGVIDGKRVPLRTLGSIMDVTEHHALEMEVQRQRKVLAEATAASGVGVFELDHRPSEGRGVFTSDTFRTLTGLGDSLSRNFQAYLERVHPDDAERVSTNLRGLLSPSGPHQLEVEHRFLAPGGEVRWLLLRATTTVDVVGPDRNPLLTVGALVDVTSTLRAQQALAERSAILDATPDFVCITEPGGELLYLNRAGRELFGLGPDAPLDGRNMSEVHPDETTADIRRNALPFALEHGVWRGENPFVDHQGRQIAMSQVILSHVYEQGPERYSTIARDLTREKELEEQFRHAQKMEAVGQLAGGIAHDFNNILSVIFGYCDLAADVLPLAHPANESVDEIRTAAERASALTHQLLAFSRKQIMQPRVIDIDQLIERACPMFKRLIHEDIEFTVVRSNTPVHVKADPNQIEQLLLNLVVNARDAMPQGGRLVIEAMSQTLDEEGAAIRRSLAPGPYVVIAISDNGVGMDAATRERIFEPFFTTKETGKGTGLGLSTVFGIVRQSGGGISVYSEVGRGTTFKIYLPSTDDMVKEEATRPVAPANTRHATVLLAEDDSQVRKMAVTVLERAGLKVLEASGPLEALGIAQAYREKIDLLVTDVVMPQMTGKQLAEELLVQRPDIKVLYMSGYTENSIVHHGVLDQGICFLPKPINAHKLLEAVTTVLDP